MPTTATSHLAVRQRTALVESVLGHPVDWSGMPDPNGFIAEVLGSTYDLPREPAFEPVRLLGRYAHCYRHADHSTASLSELVRSRCADGRVTIPMIAWTEGNRDGVRGGREEPPGVYRVRGWTCTAILRGTLSRRLDSLNPVAAFRLLEQPEISELGQSQRDYVVLRCMLDRCEASAGLFAGALWAHDIDFWHDAVPAEVEGVFALDVDTYRARFSGTGVAASSESVSGR